MTRRDYEQMARIIRGLDVGEVTRCRVAHAFADELEVTNERFNRTRFLVACVPPDGASVRQLLRTADLVRRGLGEQEDPLLEVGDE